ncbi:MAG: polysaccharide deacetylase family protein [Thermoanaerobaculia bacterium]
MAFTAMAVRTLDAALARSPFQAFFSQRGRLELTVLAYHHTRDRDTFTAQMDWLCRTHHPVSLEEVVHGFGGESPLPPRAALVTFDDADPSLLEVARPVLQERGIPAVAFVVTGLLGTTQPFWWEEVESLIRAGGRIRSWPPDDAASIIRSLKRVDDETRLRCLHELRQTAAQPAEPRPHLRPQDLSVLEEAGIEIGSHSATHPCLPRCSDEKIEWELREARGVLSSLLGHEPRAFAYPNGDHDPRVREAVQRAGYRVGFLFDHRISTWPPEDPLRISRVRVNSTASADRFRIIASGLHPLLHHALGRP